jgi:hypothetical protein
MTKRAWASFRARSDAMRERDAESDSGGEGGPDGLRLPTAPLSTRTKVASP